MSLSVKVLIILDSKQILALLTFSYEKSDDHRLCVENSIFYIIVYHNWDYVGSKFCFNMDSLQTNIHKLR